MKKTITAIILTALAAMSVGCTKKSESSENPIVTTPAVTTSAEPAAIFPTETSAAEPVTEGPTLPSADGYLVHEGGGITFGKPVEEQEDDVLIAAARELYSRACETEWRFTVGSPYELDHSSTVQNSLGWDFYLITDSRINSLDDVRADYHQVFSEQYTDAIDETFMEDGGHAYCFDGSRGANIFYEETVITGITDKSENEIVFSVENRYSDDGFGGGAYSSSEEFTAVIDSDGIWRVMKFRLPY